MGRSRQHLGPTRSGGLCCRQRPDDAQFFFKQWGAYTPAGRRVGKKVAGRVLNGRTWDEMPREPDLVS